MTRALSSFSTKIETLSFEQPEAKERTYLDQVTRNNDNKARLGRFFGSQKRKTTVERAKWKGGVPLGGDVLCQEKKTLNDVSLFSVVYG